METRALGKGLSALIPDKPAQGKPDGTSKVKTKDIKLNSLQPRKNYNDEKLAELMSSIKEQGILQPILVRKRDQGYEVVAGERRLRAAQKLNLDEVPVVVKDVSDNEAIVLALVENIQREELNAIEEAEAFSRLINEFQLTQEAVAKSVSKNRSTISNILRLLKLPEAIKKSVAKGDISEGHARTLVAIEDNKLQKDLFEYTIKNGLSVRELEQMVKSGASVKSRREKVKTLVKDSNVALLEEALQKVLGTKVNIVPKKKRGKIVIEYYSHEDLQRILKLFKR